MKKYTCEKCWWIEEQPDTYPQNVFQWAIEAHTNHFCKNKEKSYKQKLIDLLKSDAKVKEAMEKLEFGCRVKNDWEVYVLDNYTYIVTSWYITEPWYNIFIYSISIWKICDLTEAEIIWLPLSERFIRMYCENKWIYICITTSWFICWVDIDKPYCKLDNTKDFDNQDDLVYQKIYEALLELKK